MYYRVRKSVISCHHCTVHDIIHNMTKQQKKLREDFFRRCGPNIKTMATAFESLPNIGFYIKDENGRIIAINRYNCEMCNIPSPDYAIGKKSSDIFPQSFADFCTARDDTVRKTGKPIINRRYMKPANLSVEVQPMFIVYKPWTWSMRNFPQSNTNKHPFFTEPHPITLTIHPPPHFAKCGGKKKAIEHRKRIINSHKL